MNPIRYIKSTAVPLPMENVDTDQIIPARFLKAVDKSGFGANLFYDWRYDRNGNPNPEFVLNNSVYNGEILVAGKNFGCGSSREHAAWAISQYGFTTVISSFFADIFKANALNNGVLVVEVTDEFLHKIFDSIESDPKSVFTIDLEKQQLILPGEDRAYNFDIDPYKKQCLLSGQDDMDYLLSLTDKIKEFESHQVIY